MKTFKEFCGDLGELAFKFHTAKGGGMSFVAGKRGATQAKAMGPTPKPRKPAGQQTSGAQTGAQTGAQQTHTAPQQPHVAPQQPTGGQQGSGSNGAQKAKKPSAVGAVLKGFVHQQAAKNFGLAGKVAATAAMGKGPSGGSSGGSSGSAKTGSAKPKANPKPKAAKTAKSPKGAPKATPYPGAKRT